ncbi:MAG: hypothetical protein ABSD39_11845 [Terriglobales bacterium]|jgi:hypothetical protein
MRERLLARLTPFFVLAFLLGVLLATPQSALAQFDVNAVVINVGAPQIPASQGLGLLVFELYDVNAGSTCLVNVYIKAGMSSAVAAQRITEAMRRVIKGCSCPFEVIWLKPNTVKLINKDPNRTIWGVDVNPPDTTGEGDTLTIAPPVKGTWQWDFTFWIYPNGLVPPSGTVLSMTATEPGGTVFSVSLTADGVLDTYQLQQMAISQLEGQGLTFTKMINPLTGTLGYQTQWFPGTSTSGSGSVQWNSDWASYMGTFGVLAGPQ